MVSSEKESKSLNECINYVYFKLRISEPVLDSDGKLRKVFNGVSVNSWFSPMGIKISHEKDSIPYSPISKSLQTKLQERAKSASAVLGRRHFEIEQQAVGKDEILEGNSVFKDQVSDIRRQKNKSASGRFCGSVVPHSTEGKAKIIHRPYTSHGVRPNSMVYENLTINAKSLEISSGDKSNKETNSKDLQLLSDFRTEHQMKMAFVKRVKSAPPLCTKYENEKDLNNKSKDSTPLYWRTKSMYHRKHADELNARETKEDSVSRGSLWKPLLYSTDGGVKHKAGCPYKCKGCFRACLVSQDYMDKLKNGQIKRDQNKRSVRPKFYHRRIVEFAIANAQPIKQLIEREREEKALKMKKTNNCENITIARNDTYNKVNGP